VRNVCVFVSSTTSIDLMIGCVYAFVKGVDFDDFIHATINKMQHQVEMSVNNWNVVRGTSKVRIPSFYQNPIVE